MLLSILFKKAHDIVINHYLMLNTKHELIPIKDLFSPDTSTLSF